MRCTATAQSGDRCRRDVVDGDVCEKHRRQDEIIARIKDMIRGREDDPPSWSEMADALGLTERSVGSYLSMMQRTGELLRVYRLEVIE